ncbi:TPA: hypothetical protein L9P67_002307 [Klebsiella pneumoniae]|uniref:hypothetical protein n=2 Tax=Klebsiella pneumoniae TaxID=573 RepID=UPI000E2BC17E|nr:hypothetical protein [Klebsiella pneumoniae]HBY0667412.1 hypothetical protein [Klebsiella pneumoniae subsp. pneumoniae]MCE7395553.1 hypothetical protein [Klebsiella pneumoniae]MCQ1491243.1 hypothetical protein [Klebsiella pneumoniae]MDK7826285.1 hypothetical protein [Klebsiella pneumoniae]MDT4383085.1 hypothetical protein [Klebsiella pneumoniae]
MTREATLFNIRYSFHIETMQATLYNRVDKFLTFAQILLGSAIFADYGSLPLFGACVATISIVSFVWQPGKMALLHETQAKKMKALTTMPASISDDDLYASYQKAEETDNPTLGLLRDAAYKRAWIAMGHPEESKKVTLTVAEKIFAWLAGDLPKDH